VNALDARHFNVCCGAGPRDVRGEPWRLLTAAVVLRQSLHHLAGAENA
jgi:hypothetical protein